MDAAWDVGGGEGRRFLNDHDFVILGKQSRRNADGGGKGQEELNQQEKRGGTGGTVGGRGHVLHT